SRRGAYLLRLTIAVHFFISWLSQYLIRLYSKTFNSYSMFLRRIPQNKVFCIQIIKKIYMSTNNFFEKFSDKITGWTGSSTAFGIAFGVVVGWGLSGPIFKYSDTW